MVLCGISTPFDVLSPCLGQIVHALLTRPPLTSKPKLIRPLDLHVLSTPPAFVLSQDQTLMFNPLPFVFRFRFFPARQSASVASTSFQTAIHSFSKSDCLFFSILCIVFKDRCRFGDRSCRSPDDIEHYTRFPMGCQPPFDKKIKEFSAESTLFSSGFVTKSVKTRTSIHIATVLTDIPLYNM